MPAFDAREIDVLFAATDWHRASRNYELVARITRRLGDLRVHIAGEVPYQLDDAVHYEGVASGGALLQLVANARTVVDSSAYNASSSALFHAAALDCNVIASRNCGNWPLCPPELVVGHTSVEAYAEKISRAAVERYPGDAAAVASFDCYDHMKDLLAVF